jgi:hypothetical protein
MNKPVNKVVADKERKAAIHDEINVIFGFRVYRMIE